MPRSAGEFLEDMNAMQHQSMLARMSGGNGSADALAGGLMARGGAVARPMLSGLQGALGLDPMSLGMRAGMGAWSSGAGVMGAGLAGAGVAAGVGIAGAGAAFVGHQLYTGAQQQYMLNQGLKQNFNFVNSQGGMGFTGQQGFQIGNQIRGMSHEFGPSGEVATFGELSRLATNMGRMGMGQDVRSVKDFKDKFKEMVTTLKTIATDMGTSLEEAQKFMQSMRGSGIFRTADQLKMSAGTRLGAAAGGLAMSEMTGMANIGSQISRSVGGTGRQGAFGGMGAIEKIGLAQKVGALSEEDIYNATGLSGAEGRQALATSRMQQDARFLSTGRGRKFLASIADKNGGLNEEAAMEYLYGNVSTGRTTELANKNLAKVGRANFIRNEGRLRGAALERFEGMANIISHKQWLADRGYDPSNMDDKAMLAFQRFTNMGRDDADNAIKQVNKMPDMLREKDFARGELAYSDDLNKYKKSVGIEGLKRKFDQTREKIQSSFQEAGANILRTGSDAIGTWFNKLMGIYERQQVEGVAEAVRMAKMGHGGASSEMSRMTHATSQLQGFKNLSGVGGLTTNKAGKLVSKSDGSMDAPVGHDFTSIVTGAHALGTAKKALFGPGGSSQEEINNIIGSGVIHSEESKGAQDAFRTAGVGMLGMALLGPIGAVAVGGAYAAKKVNELTKGSARATDTGAYARTREGQQMIAGMLEGKGANYEAAQAKIKELSGKEHLDSIEQGALDTLRTTSVSRDLAATLQKSGKKDVNDLSPEERKAVLDQAKTTFGREVSWEEAVKGLGSTVDAVKLIEHASIEQAADMTKKDLEGTKSDLVASGIAEMQDGKLVIKAGATDGMNAKAREALSISAGLANTDFGTTDESKQSALDSIYGNKEKGLEGLYSQRSDVFNKGSIQERAAAAKQLGMLTEEGREFAGSVARENRLTKTMKKYQTRTDAKGKAIDGRFESAAAEYLGVEVSGDMREAFAKGDISSVAKTIMQEKGITAKGKDAESYQKELERALTAGRKGELGVAASALSSVDQGAQGDVKKQIQAAKEAKMGPAEKSEAHLRKMVENSDKQTAALSRIANKLDEAGNPEGDGKGGFGPPTPGGGK